MSQASQRLKGRRILVTGSASGIGEAIADLFAREGASLVLVDLNAENLSAVADRLDARSVAYDLADLPGIEAMVEASAEQIGGLDGVVNCAALGTPLPIEQMDLDLTQKFAAINLLAPYMICKAALPFMRAAGGGTIVNIASGQGLLPNAPMNTAYAATKGGLISFSKSLAAEVAPLVRVNAVCPGITNTPMAAPLFKQYSDPSEAPFVQQYAMKRIAEPIEIANAVLFLTSDESSFVTGSALAVDGGRCFH
jgi:NAD(P)-dependent dehydrogenase (short-subunit alcohol dehydrogenase family)